MAGLRRHLKTADMPWEGRNPARHKSRAVARESEGGFQSMTADSGGTMMAPGGQERLA